MEQLSNPTAQPVVPQKTRGLNGNQLKFIAIIAMTIDHVTSVLVPDYPKDPLLILLHIIGRITAPIMWFFIAEGFHYTRNIKKYALRLLLFAIVSHFAYNFAFGIPFIPFQTSIFNQTSVIWSLFWGLIMLYMMQISDTKLKPWVKIVLLMLTCVITFCSDWSCIAVLAIIQIGTHRGDFKRQALGVLFYVAMYAAVYFFFIDKVYGIMQLFVCLSFPLLKRYNGERGKWRGMKWFFYLYYPLHLVLCGILRIMVHGNIGVMIGG